MILLFLTVCGGPLLAVPVSMNKTAVEGPVDISAQTLEYDKARDVYKARGDVDLREGARRLTADNVFYYKDTEDVFAEGNVVFQEGDDVVRSEKVHVNLMTKTGTIEKGTIYIKQGNFTIVGEQIEKVGENQYKIKEGQFTTCDMPGPDWKFSARDVDITVEGYAKTKGTRFHILDQTVLYLPYGIFPVKTERQSGFLLPEFVSSSRDGMKLKESYFWAIDKDKDATLALQYIEQRGFLAGSEVRYTLKEDLKGSWNFGIIDDRKYDRTRIGIVGKHEQTLFNETRFKTNIDWVSDKDYLQDFSETTPRRSENLLKSTAYVEHPYKGTLLTVEGAYFRNLTTRSNDTTYKYYPHATFFTEYFPLLGKRLYTDLYTDFINFYREKGDTYSRMSMEPKLWLPLSWNGLNFLINGTLYERAYLVGHSNSENNDTKSTTTGKIEADANIQLMRNYNLDMLNLGEVQSLIKPQVKYTFISDTSYEDIPSIDPYDRISKTNAITYSINHYLHGLTGQNARELSVFEISQTYGLSGDLEASDAYKGSGGRFSDVDARLTLYLLRDLAYTNETTLNVHGKGLTTVRNILTHTIPGVYYASIDHNYTRDFNDEIYLDVGGKYGSLGGRYQIRYSFKDSEWIDALYELIYQPKCWAVILSLTQTKRPRDTSIKISFDLMGLTTAYGTDRALRR
jgi:LPS-assembly protein